MQLVGTQLQTILDQRSRDLIYVYEIYASDYDPSVAGFDPRDALETFAGQSYTLPFGPTVYRREVLEGPTIHKTTGKEFNSVSITFSNVSRYMSDFVLGNTVEEMRLVVRLVSRSVATAIGNSGTILDNTIVEFVGRCQKPDGFDRQRGTITAKPDMGTITAQIPARVLQTHCPLDFKGPECLGTETLPEKSAAYQAAVICNKLKGGNCTDYENTEFFQGADIIQITSSFVHKEHVGFFKKLLNYGAFGLGGRLFGGRKSTEVSNSIHDGTPYGNPIPLIFGRWSKVLMALQYQDIGTSINFLMAACRGKISDFINIKNESLGFTQPLGLTKHRGEYGGDGSQTADTVFPGGNFWSRLAYITGYCNGSDIEAEDPAPSISAVIAGIVPDSIYFDVDPDGTGKLVAGSGGVTAPGSSTTAPADPEATYDAAVVADAPELYFKLEELAASSTWPNTDATDSSGNARNGSLLTSGFGGIIQGLTGPIETDAVSYGMAGAVAQYPPSSNTSGVIKPSTAQIALEVWAKRSTTSTGVGHPVQTMIGHGGDVAATYMAFGQRGTGLFADRVVFSLRTSAGGYQVVSQFVSASVWHHVVGVRDGEFMGIYVDGCLSASRTDLPADAVSNPESAPWRLGWMTNLVFQFVNKTGGLSHVAIYPNSSLSSESIAVHYASGVLSPIGCPGEDWTDNPVDHTRYILTEPSLMNQGDNSIDDYLSAYAAAYNCGAIKDDTNAERCLLANTETSRAGVDYKRYYSTGLLGPQSFQSTRTQIPAGVPAREAVYEFFDPASPPTSLDVVIEYRKRYACNIEAAEARKAVDFLYDTILPTFRGFLRWNIKGQTVIDSERPADWTGLQAASIVGATQLTVQDVLPWKNTLGSPYLLEGKIHIDRQIAFIYATSIERISATGFVAGDVGRYALQKDNNTIWQLTATTPTWTQVTDEISEVRGVTAAVYSSLGDAITLAASASGGPSAIASGSNLAGGSPTVQSSGTVTITGSLTADATITVTIDGIDCVLTLVTGESSSTIGHRMACVINATPEVNTYVEAHAASNVVTIKSKLGVLTLSSALEEAHDVNTELTRVMAAFTDKARTESDTTRSNFLDGSFEWPDAGRQSLTNQIKAEYREAVRDFGKQPLLVNDYVHQAKTRQRNTAEIDLQAVDNYNQAARLTNGYLNKWREGDFFYKWGSTGAALLLDEGDIVCVSHYSGGSSGFRNKLCRIEDIQIKQLEVSFVARKYSRVQLSDLVALPAGLQLPSATSFGLAPPDIAFNTEDFPPDGLAQTTAGADITSIRGGVIFGASIYAQYAKVRLTKRGGVTVSENINSDLRPNEDLEAVFEFIASVEGVYTVEVQACNQWGCSTAISADITVAFGALGVWLTQEGGKMLTQAGDYMASTS